MEQTRLQKIVEQKADQIRAAIEQTIDEGAEIKDDGSCVETLKCCTINGVHLQKVIYDGTILVVLNFRSEKIAKIFEPSKEDLAKLADQKRKELAEIEQQLNERANE